MAAKETVDPYRVALSSAVAVMIRNAGFTTTEPAALESLLEMVQSFITQLGKSAKHYAEVANRAQVMVTDVSMALIEAGVSLEDLKGFGEVHMRKPSAQTPLSETETQRVKPLAINSSTVQPAYVHDNLPQFPDKHTYIQTSAQRHPTTDYQLVRQKASTQRKNTETALTKFIAKTGEANYYCDDVDNPINKAFPLIACKPSALSYLSTLMPKDESEFEVFDLKQEQDLPEMPTRTKRVKIDLEGNVNHSMEEDGR